MFDFRHLGKSKQDTGLLMYPASDKVFFICLSYSLCDLPCENHFFCTIHMADRHFLQHICWMRLYTARGMQLLRLILINACWSHLTHLYMHSESVGVKLSPEKQPVIATSTIDKKSLFIIPLNYKSLIYDLKTNNQILIISGSLVPG